MSLVISNSFFPITTFCFCKTMEIEFFLEYSDKIGFRISKIALVPSIFFLFKLSLFFLTNFDIPLFYYLI